jgi:hypothetical protein
VWYKKGMDKQDFTVPHNVSYLILELLERVQLRLPRLDGDCIMTKGIICTKYLMFMWLGYREGSGVQQQTQPRQTDNASSLLEEGVVQGADDNKLEVLKSMGTGMNDIW